MLFRSSPLAVLSRGYSLCWLDDGTPDVGRALVGTDGIARGDRLVTQLESGRLYSSIDRVEPAAR